VWIWDTPFDVTFIIEGEQSLLDDTSLAAFLEKVINWNSEEMRVKKLKIRFPSQGGGIAGRGLS
jgi:hypothetical protein